jgi:hypothetical protein
MAVLVEDYHTPDNHCGAKDGGEKFVTYVEGIYETAFKQAATDQMQECSD